MGMQVESGALGLRLKSLFRYEYKAKVYLEDVIYVVDDAPERKRLQLTGYFDLVELDPQEHVLMQSGGHQIAVRDPMTAVKLLALSGNEPKPKKRTITSKKKAAKKKAPKEIQAGEPDPDDEDDDGVEV